MPIADMELVFLLFYFDDNILQIFICATSTAYVCRKVFDWLAMPAFCKMSCQLAIKKCCMYRIHKIAQNHHIKNTVTSKHPTSLYFFTINPNFKL